MNRHDDDPLEAEISRELKSLSKLRAPAGLARRIMARIEVPTARARAWSWEAWPAGLRIASFIALLGIFVVLCVFGWKLSSDGMLATGIHELSGRFAGVTAILETCRILLDACVLVVKKLGTGFIAACLTLAALSYFLCIGAGTVFVRYAFSRR